MDHGQYTYYHQQANGDPHAIADHSDFSANPAAYPSSYGLQQPPALDMNTMRQPQMQLQYMPQHQHAHPASIPVMHPSSYDTRHVYHHSSIPSASPVPQSPYEPISPAQSLSDHSHSGTESVGHIHATGGVPHHNPRLYGHHHSHSISSSSSSSSIIQQPQELYSAAPGDYHTPSRGRPRRERRIPPETPPHLQSRELASPTSDEDPSFAPLHISRKENTRRQRIEAEQRRRDELRDGYGRLKEVLPISPMKSSKVNLIERARQHIIELDDDNKTLKAKVDEMEREIQRLREVTDKLMMSVAQPLHPPSTGGPSSTSNGSPATISPVQVPLAMHQSATLGLPTGYSDDDSYVSHDGQTPQHHVDADVTQYLVDSSPGRA